MGTTPILLKLASTVHSALYRFTAGRIGGRISGVSVLVLTTTGRRTARPRSTPLLYLQDGRNLVIIASNGGRNWHPAWYRNLRSRSDVWVQVGGRREEMVAFTAGPAEHDRIWPAVLRAWPKYAEYQRRTSRHIPLVILSPRPEP